jgi:hypothetical protein
MKSNVDADVNHALATAVLEIVAEYRGIQPSMLTKKWSKNSDRYLVCYLIYYEYGGSKETVSSALNISAKNGNFFPKAKKYIEHKKGNIEFIHDYVEIIRRLSGRFNMPVTNIPIIGRIAPSDSADDFTRLLQVVWTTCHSPQTLISFQAVESVRVSRQIAIVVAHQLLHLSVESLMERFGAGEEEIFFALGKIQYACNGGDDKGISRIITEIKKKFH